MGLKTRGLFNVQFIPYTRGLQQNKHQEGERTPVCKGKIQNKMRPLRWFTLWTIVGVIVIAATSSPPVSSSSSSSTSSSPPSSSSPPWPSCSSSSSVLTLPSSWCWCLAHFKVHWNQQHADSYRIKTVILWWIDSNQEVSNNQHLDTLSQKYHMTCVKSNQGSSDPTPFSCIHLGT